MINIFCPNGISSQKIITKLARKEFGEAIGTVNSYVELKRAVIKVLKKLRNMLYLTYEKNNEVFT
mgnify:FL=1